jgi:hypothetical protein
MWDMKTGRSRGYGFVAFRQRDEAEKALSSMDGEWLGSRAIRCNWANQKGQPSISQQQAMVAMGMTPTTPAFTGHHTFPTQGVQSYETIVAQTPSWQTTTYVGNLTPYTTQNDLVPLFQNFGYVVETRFQSDRGFAFIKMDTHENAAMAICQLSGYNVNGRPLKCSVSCQYISNGTEANMIHSGAKIVHRLASSMATLDNPVLLRSHRPLAMGFLSMQTLQCRLTRACLNLLPWEAILLLIPRQQPLLELLLVAMVKILEATSQLGLLPKDSVTSQCHRVLVHTDRTRMPDGLSSKATATMLVTAPATAITAATDHF